MTSKHHHTKEEALYMDQKDVLRLAALDAEWKQVYVWNQSFKKDIKMTLKEKDLR